MTAKLKKKSWSLQFLLESVIEETKGSANSDVGGDEAFVADNTGKLVDDWDGVMVTPGSWNRLKPFISINLTDLV